MDNCSHLIENSDLHSNHYQLLGWDGVVQSYLYLKGLKSRCKHKTTLERSSICDSQFQSLPAHKNL